MTTTPTRLQISMDEAGHSQSSLARAIGVTQGTISQLLLGKTTRSRYLPEIAQVLGVSLAWLRGEDVPRQPTPNEMLPTVAPMTIRMDVVLPSADALTQMFDAMLRPFESVDARRDEVAQALARRLPVALAQLQGSLYALEADEDPPHPQGSRVRSEDHRGSPPQPSR